MRRRPSKWLNINEGEIMKIDSRNTPVEKAVLKRRLTELGATRYDLLLPESHALINIIAPDEEINGIVYGRYKQIVDNKEGRGALVATNKRVLLLDKKPMFTNSDEIIYPVISGIRSTKTGAGMTITLHSRVGDIRISTLNSRCANGFIKAIKSSIFVNQEIYVN